MLKWTVMNKREHLEKSEQRRRSSAGICSTPAGNNQKPASKRRRSSTVRRPEASRRATHLRRSLCLENKENQYTSTPIKGPESEQTDAFRDVSNVTPNRRSLPAIKPKRFNGASPKKRKKQCVDPMHTPEFLFSPNCSGFRPFEAVDSHIEGLIGFNCGCNNVILEEKPIRPLAANFPLNNNNKAFPLLLKKDHVNDFLQQISNTTSPEDERLRFADMQIKENLKVTTLVKEPQTHNESSFINDLSLDRIVDAILDSSNETEGCSLQRQNEMNETQEENLLNSEQERQSFSDRNSTDSGFRSSTTEQLHDIDANFRCKCSSSSSQEVEVDDRTMINLNETFNERGVDVNVNTRKRTHVYSSSEGTEAKRRMLDAAVMPDVDFTLKRQKCIRRRRADERKKNENTVSSCCTDINDHSFESNERSQGDCQNRQTFTVVPPEAIDKESVSFCDINSSTPNGAGLCERGSIDLDLRFRNGELILQVSSCSNIQRPNGEPINAYVKVALSERCRKLKGTLQRTAVQAESNNPVFNHEFKLPVHKSDMQKVLHVELWHRDRATRRSEFLGCTSFTIKNAIKKNISGTYKLLPQFSRRCSSVVAVAPITTTNRAADSQRRAVSSESPTKMCESQSSVEETICFDIDADPKRTPDRALLTQQQKDADENLFLRYLELDPTEGPDVGAALAQRKATGNKCTGRTPFTTTKLLKRPPKTGFGFSVVWTHPPRIERVEKGLSADKAGILPGDYLIFVDKHNVVMMPEIDILNLIRSYGNQLTLEIFRRNVSRNGSVPSVRPTTMAMPTGVANVADTGSSTTAGLPHRRPSTVCSTNTTSMEYNRKKLHLPQVTFSAEIPMNGGEEARRRAMFQIVHREQQYATGMQFALTRFVSALAERKDLIGATEHRILFQNSEELLRITEDLLDSLVNEEGEFQTALLLRTYHSKLSEITSAYKKYCSGIKKADCVLANLSKNQEFVRFLQVPSVPRRRPDITVFIHKPLEHYREILKLLNIILSNTKPKHDDYHVISQIVHDLQLSYREMTSEAGLMEPMGEGRPLLSVQDLENRLVFTKCKPFVLTKPGRQWIFGGDLSRVEGRTIRQYWALLFSDILLFAKVSRDRVLFIMEDPLPLSQITDLFFNVRKKENEFRIIVEPGGKQASSPTVHCGPDLSRTPRKNPSKRCVVLRTPTQELKAVWQNLLQRQIFHVNAGMDGSSYSSPLESPEAPITSSVVTLQSAESLSLRRQTPRNIDSLEKDQKKQIDELIEHKCKQLEKSSSSSKSNAIHLERWMKGQLGSVGGGSGANLVGEEDDFEVWTEDMVRKRSEELQLIDPQGNPTSRSNDNRSAESRCEEVVFSDHDLSPSRSTNTTASQVTVRSSPLVPENVSVCRQCHKSCFPNQNGANDGDSNNTNVHYRNNNNPVDRTNGGEDADEDNDWRPLMLMGLCALNPAATLLKADPFGHPFAAAAPPPPPPRIAVVPPTPTPDFQNNISSQSGIVDNVDNNCSCNHARPQITELVLNKDYDASPDDSPLLDEQPYHSLNSSNLTLRRFGTVSSLERVGSEERDDDDYDPEETNSASSERSVGGSYEDDEADGESEECGIDNEAYNHSSILSWTARAGTFVAEKMAFFERLGGDYKTGGIFERYLRNEITMNGEDVQEEETSGATSGEEIWGTPTSGGELDEPLSSPNYDDDDQHSPDGDDESLSSNEDTELMMDELLMTPPVTSASIRGLLPRRTLEPLLEEEYSDTYTSSSSSSETRTEPPFSPEKGNGTGDAADKCSPAAETPPAIERSTLDGLDTRVAAFQSNSVVSMSVSMSVANIPRSDSYRRIIEAEDDSVGFFTRFRNRPSMKFINIERIPPTKGVRFLEFFNMRRERKIYETFPGGKHLIKVFSREGDDSDDVPTSYSDKPESMRRIKERQLDRRFWKQLSKRRGNKPIQLSA